MFERDHYFYLPPTPCFLCICINSLILYIYKLICTWNLLITISTFITYPLIPNTLRTLLFIVKLYVNRLCSLEDFNYHILNMKEWFIKRDYPESVIEKEMKKVQFSQQGQKSKKVEKGVPSVVTYHPLLNKLSSIIHRNLYLLYMNQEVKNVFTPGPIVSYRSAIKISSYLVRAKLYPLERKDWFWKM